MKRRKYGQSSLQVEGASPIRASFARGLNGDRIPKNRPKASVSHETPPGDPKTSEYAFFKKLKEDVGQRFQSQLPRHPDKSQSEKSTELLWERTIDLDNNSKAAFKPSLLPKNVTPENSFSLVSPLGTSSNKSEQYVAEFHKAWGDTQTLHENMDKYGSSWGPRHIFKENLICSLKQRYSFLAFLGSKRGDIQQNTIFQEFQKNGSI